MMEFDNTTKRCVITAVLAAALGMASPLAVMAQEPSPVLLILDRSAIDYGDETHLIPEQAANVSIANVGLRNQLPFFVARKGESFTLPIVTGGSNGWFAMRSVPRSWATEDGSNDGPENFFVAGPGLGSPDDSGDRVSLLGAVPDVVALGASGASYLVGRPVCAVVYRDEIEPGDAISLAGPNLGVVAFRVTSGDTGLMDRPSASVQILDAREVCTGTLATLSEAPAGGQ
jgi:hypothetical protein